MPTNCKSDHTTDVAPVPDVLVAEVILPRSYNGVCAAQKALHLWPGVKVLLISASPVEAWPDSAANLFMQLPIGTFAFLPKPFSVQKFGDALDALLAPAKKYKCG